MREGFPEPPEFGFSWRNLLLEPISQSGERISLAAIVKADDGSLFVPRFFAKRKLRGLFGAKFGARIAETLDICVKCAEEHFRRNPIYLDWKPPMESFHIGKAEHSTAADLEEAVVVAGTYCSSIGLALQNERSASPETSKPLPFHKQWESSIKANVGLHHSPFEHHFNSRISLKEGGVKLNVGFLCEKYAAQFEAVASAATVQRALLRAQAKLWQLDLLRDETDLLDSPCCELLLGLPQSANSRQEDALTEFVNELQYEASRRELGVFTATTPVAAAMRLIKQASA